MKKLHAFTEKKYNDFFGDIRMTSTRQSTW